MFILGGGLLLWLAFAIIVGVAANTRGRSGFGWFLLSIIISPLLAGLLVVAMRPLRIYVVENEQVKAVDVQPAGPSDFEQNHPLLYPLWQIVQVVGVIIIIGLLVYHPK